MSIFSSFIKRHAKSAKERTDIHEPDISHAEKVPVSVSYQTPAEIYTLEDCARSGKRFFKVSQSDPERHTSEEEFYAPYKPGTITYSKGSKGLSFVEAKSLPKCLMYGDQITEFSFGLSDPDFQKIKDVPVKYIGGGLGEYEADALFVKENRTLDSVDTISDIIKFIDKPFDVFTLVHGIGLNTNIDRFRKIGLYEAAEFLDFLNYNFDICKNINKCDYVKDNIDEIADRYKELKHEAELDNELTDQQQDKPDIDTPEEEKEYIKDEQDIGEVL